MANYYYVTIKSDKMTQEIASKILQEMTTKNRIRSFEFFERGELKYNTRGLTDISEILNEAGFTDKEVEIKDEFTYAYETMKPIEQVVKEEIEACQTKIAYYTKDLKLSDEVKQSIETIVKEQNKIKEFYGNITFNIPEIPSVENSILKGFKF